MNFSKCYVNTKPSIRGVEIRKCQIKKIPNDDGYAIKVFYQDGKHKIKKAFMIDTLSFILNQFWYLIASYFLIVLVTMLSMPITILSSLLLSSLIIYFVKPFRTQKGVSIVFGTFTVLFVLSAIFVVFITFVPSNILSIQNAVSLAQGVIYFVLVSYVTFFIVGHYYKFNEVYVIGIEKKDDWKFATLFVWRSYYE